MTDTNFRGPVSNMGAMEDSPATISPTDGPMYSYQGLAISNLRGGAFQKDGAGAARVPAYLDNIDLATVDNVPSAASTTILAASTSLASGTAFTLASVAPGNTTAGTPSIAPGLPIIPFGSSAPVNVIALDFGFTTGTTVAAASAVTVVDNTMFTLGQWIAIGGAGNAAKTLSLLTQVTAISTANTTTINVFPVPTGALTNAPIGGGNLWNQYLPPATQFGPGTPAPTASANELAAGLFRLFNPVGAISRNIAVSSTTSVGGTVTVNGYDVHNQQMSETLTVAAGTAVLYGKKAFKFILNVTPNFTDTTGRYTVGVGDTFGFPILCRRYPYVNYVWNNLNNSSATGYLAPDLTSPALSTTGDVRGTVQVSANGAGTGVGGTVSNGVIRLTILQTLPLLDQISATPLNTVPFFGVTQA